jgi:hypothetical protein
VSSMAETPKYDAELYKGSVGPYYPNSSDIYASGHIKNDSRKRFTDGTFVTTSKIKAFNEADNIITTESGTRYLISGMTLHPSILELKDG